MLVSREPSPCIDTPLALSTSPDSCRGTAPRSRSRRPAGFVTRQARAHLLLSYVGIVPDDVADRRVFSEFSRFPNHCIPALLHTHLASSSSTLKTSVFRATQISSLQLVQLTCSWVLRRSLVSGRNTFSFSRPRSGYWFPLRAPSVYRNEQAPAYLATLHTPLLHSLIFQPLNGRSPRKPLTSSIVRHDFHLRKSGLNRPGIELGSPLWEASSLTAQPPWPPTCWRNMWPRDCARSSTSEQETARRSDARSMWPGRRRQQGRESERVCNNTHLCIGLHVLGNRPPPPSLSATAGGSPSSTASLPSSTDIQVMADDNDTHQYLLAGDEELLQIIWQYCKQDGGYTPVPLAGGANRVQFPAGPPQIFACENRAGRCGWSAGFLGDRPFPRPCILIEVGSSDSQVDDTLEDIDLDLYSPFLILTRPTPHKTDPKTQPTPKHGRPLTRPTPHKTCPSQDLPLTRPTPHNTYPSHDRPLTRLNPYKTAHSIIRLFVDGITTDNEVLIIYVFTFKAKKTSHPSDRPNAQRPVPVCPFSCYTAPYLPHFTLIGSQDLDVKSRPNIFIHSLTHI
ncbi:hypothetical protein PR048_004998 [Dryococelus australis]|uniref:Uncharacterized protein n=1 Tax=Dryococelus australis TaxID=614101 RepID=A0ABQ9I921_9NEOP|nr:hypothetical protein PR048_004998 [Dryococelus australis]